MILDGFITLLSAVLSPIFSILPTFSLDIFEGAVVSPLNGLGQKIRPLDGVLPLVEIVGVLHTVGVILIPAVAIYKLANWIWKHLPIPGTGMGGG